jgi:ubiquinone/menaquinone biosynthesis C-methylase UbiE
LLKLGFGLLYNQMAWSYDLVSWLVSRGQWRSWQRAALPYLQGETILELAHGPGHMLLALNEAGHRVVGLDLSPFMGRLAARRAGDAQDRVSLVRGDGQSLPFLSHSFDGVLSTFPTEFLARPATIDGIYRVLKPGGRLVVVPQARLTGGSVLVRFIEWLYAITGQRPDVAMADPEGFWQVIGDRFRAPGFTLTFHEVRLEISQVTVVVAQKPGEGQ